MPGHTRRGQVIAGVLVLRGVRAGTNAGRRRQWPAPHCLHPKSDGPHFGVREKWRRSGSAGSGDSPRAEASGMYQRDSSRRCEQGIPVAEIQQGIHPFRRIIVLVGVELGMKAVPVLRQQPTDQGDPGCEPRKALAMEQRPRDQNRRTRILAVGKQLCPQRKRPFSIGRNRRDHAVSHHLFRPTVAVSSSC